MFIELLIAVSNVLDERIKQYQSRGKFGPRDICRLPFEQNIPEFDSKNELHTQIAMVGLEASAEAAKVEKTSRVKTRVAIPSMKKIDRLVLELLNKQKSISV